MKKNRLIIPAITILVAILVLVLQEKKPSGHNTEQTTIANGFNRQLRPIIYTKHAQCRMDCRRIDAAEIEDILTNGVINEDKTDIHSKPDPKYALEGKTHDNQQVRIIFAPSAKGMVVITVIDLDTDWSCQCK